MSSVRSLLKNRDLQVSALLVIATAATYVNLVGNDFLLYDDDLYVTANPHVSRGLTLSGIRWALVSFDASNWHPLTWVSHMLDCQLFGARPGAHHLVSLLLHAASAVVLFLSWRRMTGSRWPSAFAAALFALHPLHVQSVAWTAERKDVLSGLFWMLTVGAWALYAETGSRTRYLAALGLFALGLLAKPMLVTLPFVLLLLDFWPLGRFQSDASAVSAAARTARSRAGLRVIGTESELDARRAPFRRLVAEKTPFLALAVVSCALTYFAQRSGGAVAAMDKLPIGWRVENACISYVRYLWKAIWPSGLSIFYMHPGSWPAWQVAGSFALIVAATVLVLAKAHRWPFATVGWLWYLGTLVPVIGLVQVGPQAMADRYTYIPLIGMFLALAWGASSLAAHSRPCRGLVVAAACLWLAGLATASWLQTLHWRNTVTLFEHALEIDPENFLAQNNLAATLAGQGDIEGAVRHYREAVRLVPDYPKTLLHFGNLLMKHGQVDEAIVHLRKAVEVRPESAPSHASLAYALVMRGRPDEAIEHARRALALDPSSVTAETSLAYALQAQGRIDEAIAAFEAAVKLDAKDPGLWTNFGITLAARGRLEEAVDLYRRALALNPGFVDAHQRLGAALAAMERFPDAAAEYREAVRLDPNRVQARFQLGEVLLRLGHVDEARAQYLEVLRQEPAHDRARARIEALDKASRGASTWPKDRTLRDNRSNGKGDR